MAKGNGSLRLDVMHNDFVLLGPTTDPAKAKGAVLRALEDAPNFGKAQELLLALVDGRKP